jgi:NTP pyrophosphatase (non-canonical NTP hydrolase)
VTFKEFQDGIERTMNPKLDSDQRLGNAVFGLTAEIGEIAEPLKKVLYHEHPLTVEVLKNLHEEIGDLLFYTALLANVLDGIRARIESWGAEDPPIPMFTLEQIAEENAAKLKRRYPHGFEAKRSLNRGDEAKA